jgi:predicted nucleic acid-binding protein
MKRGKSVLVCDASVVLNLGHRGQLAELVAMLGAEYGLVVTDEVVREVTRDDPDFYRAFVARQFTVLSQPLAAMERIPEQWKRSLDAGELSVLALCLEHDGWQACIDETLARKAARGLGIAVTGTIGLLYRALTSGCLSDDECLEAVRRMVQKGFYCPRVSANETFHEYHQRLGERD